MNSMEFFLCASEWSRTLPSININSGIFITILDKFNTFCERTSNLVLNIPFADYNIALLLADWYYMNMSQRLLSVCITDTMLLMLLKLKLIGKLFSKFLISDTLVQWNGWCAEYWTHTYTHVGMGKKGEFSIFFSDMIFASDSIHAFAVELSEMRVKWLSCFFLAFHSFISFVSLNFIYVVPFAINPSSSAVHASNFSNEFEKLRLPCSGVRCCCCSVPPCRYILNI